MEKQQYLNALERNTEAMVAVARKDLSAAVPTCPGWTVGHVLSHVGRAYNWMGEMVRQRAEQALPPSPDEFSFDPRDPGVIPWLEESLARFYGTMKETDPDQPVWSWAGDNRAGFWLRLEAHETAVHRADVELALGEAEPIEPTLAADAVNGMVDWFLPRLRNISLLPSRGERYLFRQTDGDQQWLLTFGKNGVTVSRELAESDVTVAGPASDILLFLWHRIPAERLSSEGNPDLLERYRDLVPGT